LFEGVIDENLEIKEYLTKVLEARDYYAEKAQLNQAER
jgi:hypothetical protein